ncbi:probable LRR receptor-like serine/threonine-protein kinase At3g47570 [Pistacia vera]|uniref:probable LRR receptor-like serine/threonine-protein kinase At3g47570 n=1 Tax=Pistacia vera TaxID=55513 RepID=UPI00126328A0|nr:probable LRR receptor-like serine/threonine-protein kinase At3g47570 [Pistacia vera]
MSRTVFCSFSFYLLLLFWSSLLSYGSVASASSVLKSNETDKLALLEFKAKVAHDPLQVLSSWNDSNLFCQWEGVTCSRRHQRVTKLRLPHSKLEGSLLPSIGNLSFLRVLNLNNNSFRNEIPHEIGYLFRLQYLNLQNNSFRGEIPSNLSGCANLEWFSVGNNKMVGKLPGELGSLSKLRGLYVFSNNLTGEVPISFGNLSSLEILSASINQFEGRIPATLGRLKRIKVMAFGGNKLSGTIPPSIYNISSLEEIDFEVNQLKGSLPLDLGFTLPSLVVLSVATNQFTGPIPPSISNASNLTALAISDNRFSGKVPTFENLHKLRRINIYSNQLGHGEEDDLKFLNSLQNATTLEELDISYNNFGCILPDIIGNFSTQLISLSVDNNQMFGKIPIGVGNLVNFEVLDLWMNQFTGYIPSSIGNLQKLQTLQVHGNKFSGDIPSSLGNLTLLRWLRLDRNNLQGTIPSSLGRCTNLEDLDLSRNNLSGTIPPEVTSLSSLSIYLDLSLNQLTGSLPSNVGNFTNLGVLDISENKLSGEIPGSLGSCVSLQQLAMDGNFFEGNIPSSLSSLRGIDYLDLSSNNLSGQIPKYLVNFPFLMNLNLSDNDFEGEVPIGGVFNNASAISLSGNDKLCGGITELHLSKCPVKGSKKTRFVSKKVIIPIVVGILLLTMMLCLIIIRWWRRTKRNSSSASPLLASLLQVSYDNLLKATAGFSSENLIGSGSFGYVYKGILDHNEMVVAVKVLNLQHRGASRSFLAECEALRSIRHRNLVKIITACASVDFQGNDFKALIYEFMVNGSLEKWLHPNVTTDVLQEAPRNLNFLQSIDIAINVACAVDYLHNHGQTPMVHCDLKPSNVLLDDELTAHVGDFGLARFLLEGTHSLSSNQTSSIGVRGTVGYAAPEYGMGSEVSTQGDVYSYGILLLEMFTGKRPTDEMFNGDMNLHDFVKAAIPERVIEIVDPILLQETEEGQTSLRSHSVRECLIAIFGIGVTCSSRLPSERMNMDDVTTQLHSIKNKLLQTPRRGQRLL